MIITVLAVDFCFVAQAGVCWENSLFHNIFKGGVSACKHPWPAPGFGW